MEADQLKEKILAFMREEVYKPLIAEDLANYFKEEDLKAFLDTLREMELTGQVICTRHNRYGVPEKMHLVVGKLQGHQKGFGFVIPDRAGEEDVFIPENGIKGAMHNDRVIARIQSKSSNRSRREGEIIRILQRANEKVVGTYEKARNFGFVIPDDSRIAKDIYIPQGENMGVGTGAKVEVQITKWPELRRNPEGKVIQLIGYKGDPGIDIESIIRKYGLPFDFPDEVKNQVAGIADHISPEEIAGRQDLRDILMVTIDGEDAKDLDDAVSLQPLPNGNYRLGVHIADVSYYVREGSPLDQEAYNRGTSVYLVDRVIPMLPPKLSNGICSLNPQVDRLAMSVFMEINEQGKVVAHEIMDSVININERMTYKKVSRILIEKDEQLMDQYAGLLEMFNHMEKLCQILRRRRLERGAIDFDFPETKVILDAQGKPIDLVRQDRSIADQIIEEFMLITNETVAEHFHWLEVPFLYRVHEEPGADKIQNLREFLYNFGYTLKGKNGVHPKAFQSIVNEVEGKPEQKVINTVMLRTMKQARYSEESLGHYGLAAEFYSHFTSPIRRYPDLIIHRIMREVISNGQLKEKRKEKLTKIMPDIAKQSSERERLAMEAERDSVDLKKVEFMQDRIGEEFAGIISGVTAFGIFVELPNSVEGLVHITNMHDDYYDYNEKQYLLLGQHTKKVYRLGDEVKVKIVKVNTDERQIDFELV